MIKVIIFDFDGVLVESVHIKTKAFTKLFESHGDDIVKKVVGYHLKNAGVSRFEKFRYFYKEVLNRDLTEEAFVDLCQRFSKLVVYEVVNAPYVNGAKEFLDNYGDLYNCFIASATPQNEIEEIITQRTMRYYFKGIYGAPQKKADIVKKIIDSNSLMPEEIVCIGDALSDYEAAKVNSVHFIARVTSVNHIFEGINCLKMRDLCELKLLIEKV